MELFYSGNIKGGTCILNEEESRHCSKVLRHTVGDMINVIDGVGGMYDCKISSIGKEVICEVVSCVENFGGHNYNLIMAVAPTKNIDRYEWFIEKATEIGVDSIIPVIGEHSQRRILKSDRLCKILVSAAKQSLKAAIPALNQTESVTSFIKRVTTQENDSALKLIAYCGSAQKISISQAVINYLEFFRDKQIKGAIPHIIILIGPEGDFSPSEVEFALNNGFNPIHLGQSRLRTETAAIAAVSCVYFTVN